MIEQEITDIDFEAFETDYSDANAYYHRALQFLKEGTRFSLVFNIASVALERYLLALCDLYGKEPRNHNYMALMQTVETVIDVPAELSKKIRFLDFIFGICSIDEYRHPDPSEADMDNVLYLCTEVQKLFDTSRITTARSVSGNLV